MVPVPLQQDTVGGGEREFLQSYSFSLQLTVHNQDMTQTI